MRVIGIYYRGNGVYTGFRGDFAKYPGKTDHSRRASVFLIKWPRR